MECFREDGKPSEEAASVELRDDGLYQVTCSRAHVTVSALQEQKFEVLFDLGAMALLDGYPREGVSSMAASLERFFEYYVLVVSLKHSIAIENFAEAWKPISRQSERQLGAFLFLYLLESKRPLDPFIYDARPELPGRSKKETLNWGEFRNSVIHKGYIPSTDEVIAYGDLVYQFIYRLIGELRTNCSEFMQKASFYHIRRAGDVADGKPIATISIPTLISLVRVDKPAQSLRDALSGLEKYRRWLYHKPQPN